MSAANSTYDATIIMPPMWHIREPWTAPAYICQALRSHGCKVQFLDFNVQLYRLCEKLGYSYLWHKSSLYDSWILGQMNYLVHLLDLDEIQSNLIGISLTHTSVSFGIALLKLLRERFPKRKILLGGHALLLPEEAAAIPLELADAICKGEGEQTICEVMDRGVEHFPEIPGLYVPGDKGWRLTSERPCVQDLDILAWPRFEDINLDVYGEHLLPLMGSRGCIGRCVFCRDRYRTPGFRTRSAASQIEELEYLSQAFEVAHFPYNDPLLNGDLEVLTLKTDEISRRGLTVQYGGNLMIRKDMPSELFPKMRRSGMAIALIGLESGSATTLKGMRKRHTPELAEWFIRECHNAGIKTDVNIIVGFPTETEEHFQETCDFVKRNHQYIDSAISIMPLYLQPSALRDHRDRYNIILDGTDNYTQWHVEGMDNTHEIRLERAERFGNLARELGLIDEQVMFGGRTAPTETVPSGREFLQAYLDYWNKCECQHGAERDKALAAARRMEISIDTSFSIPNVLRTLRKAPQKLRKSGFKKTIRLGKEWIQTRRQ